MPSRRDQHAINAQNLHKIPYLPILFICHDFSIQKFPSNFWTKLYFPQLILTHFKFILTCLLTFKALDGLKYHILLRIFVVLL